MFKLKPLIVLVFILSFISCDQINSTRIIRLGHGLSTSHSVTKEWSILVKKLKKYPVENLKSKSTPVNNWDRASVFGVASNWKL